MGVAATPQPSATDTAPTPSTSAAAPPTAAPGMRLVGVGRAVIEVPNAWGTNDVRCGTPLHDTVVIDVWLVEACGVLRPPDARSVELRNEPADGFVANERLTVDGVAAERQNTACPRHPYGAKVVCTGAIYLPSLNAWFRASASGSDGSEVDRILSRIHPAGGGVPVPRVPERLVAEAQADSGTEYAAAVKAAGLVPRVVPRRDLDLLPGVVLAAQPQVGSVLAPGATVTITVSAR